MAAWSDMPLHCEVSLESCTTTLLQTQHKQFRVVKWNLIKSNEIKWRVGMLAGFLCVVTLRVESAACVERHFLCVCASLCWLLHPVSKAKGSGINLVWAEQQGIVAKKSYWLFTHLCLLVLFPLSLWFFSCVLSFNGILINLQWYRTDIIFCSEMIIDLSSSFSLPLCIRETIDESWWIAIQSKCAFFRCTICLLCFCALNLW